MAIFNKILCKTPGCNYWRTRNISDTTGSEVGIAALPECPTCGGEIYVSKKFTLQWYEAKGGKRTKTFDTAEEAFAVWSKIESDRKTQTLLKSLGITPPEQSKVTRADDETSGKNEGEEEPDGSTPFDVVASEFQTFHACKIKDVERERIAINHLIRFFGKMPIGKILNKHLMAYQTERQDHTVLEGRVELTKAGLPYKRVKKPRNVAASTVGRELTVLKMIRKYAEKNDYLSVKQISKYPFEGFEMPEARTIEHIITPEQREKLLQALPILLRSLFEFLYESGCRISEVTNLTWSRVEELSTIAKLKDSKSQKASGGVETLFLSPMAWEIIRAQPRKCEYVFFNPKTRTKYKSLNKAFQKAAIKAELVFDGEVFRPHDLRHNFLTEVAETEVSDSTLMMISRHKDVRSLHRYVHRRKKVATDQAYEMVSEKRQKRAKLTVTE